MGQENQENNIEVVTAYRDIPYSVISQEIPSYKKNDFYTELEFIKEFYKVYELGAEFTVEGTNNDYVGSSVRFKKCKTLIDKEARFLFAHTPDIYVNKDTAHTEEEKLQASIINDYITSVYKKNGFGVKLVKAAKDCFIGRRVACMLNFNEESGISITFLKSYEFIYEKDDSEELTKLVAFYIILDTLNRSEQRIKKKSYEMKDGLCYTHEILYDGLGNMLEETVPEQPTEFTYIPGAVILNDGLSNDSKGESEIEQLDDFESLYSRLANSDVDSERKNMNSVRYTIDASAESTESLSTAPGAFWDIKSDSLSPDPRTAQVGMLESSMSYSGPLKVTLDRVNTQMHSQIDVPDINSEQLQGVITSGKTLKALYWALTVRCDEKMLSWRPALEHITKAILDGGILYPESTTKYTEELIPEIEFDITVENNYALPDDDAEEKNQDLSEVASQTMSRKAYMKKWRNLTDEEVDEELKQILMEKQLFEDGAIPTEGTPFGEDTEDVEDTEEAEYTEEDVEAEKSAQDSLLEQLDALMAEMGG